MPASVKAYLAGRPFALRALDVLRRRCYLISRLVGRPAPVVVIAHRWSDRSAAHRVAHSLEHDWMEAPESSRAPYDQILLRAPDLVVLQLRRKNVCGCLGHRHILVRESPFAAPHEIFGAAAIGEMDIAFEQIDAWHPLPLSDTAIDVKFLSGSRQREFHERQFRLKVLSVFMHELNHLVFPPEPEASVLGRSLEFYREALESYAARALSTVSLTLDRSPSRLRL